MTGRAAAALAPVPYWLWQGARAVITAACTPLTLSTMGRPKMEATTLPPHLQPRPCLTAHPAHCCPPCCPATLRGRLPCLFSTTASSSSSSSLATRSGRERGSSSSGLRAVAVAVGGTGTMEAARDGLVVGLPHVPLGRAVEGLWEDGHPSPPDSSSSSSVHSINSRNSNSSMGRIVDPMIRHPPPPPCRLRQIQPPPLARLQGGAVRTEGN